jgi:hypothetical protein
MTKPKMTPQKPSAKKKSAEVTKPYEPTEREQVALEAHHARNEQSKPSPCLKVEKKNNELQISTDHQDPLTGQNLLLEALGTASDEFLEGIMLQLAESAAGNSAVDERKLNFMLSVITGMEPKDQTEAMLAAQMAAVHMQTMTFSRRLNHVDTIHQQNSAERAFNKLARTFTTQMEALNRYRGKGQQKMTVEHVHVHEGGQAIVGNVQGGGGNKKNEGQPDAKATDA